MTYAFIIVVSVAITMKLMFLSFSLYYTVKSSEAREKKVAAAAGASGDQNKKNAKSLLISWKQLPRMILPRSLYCPEPNNKIYISK